MRLYINAHSFTAFTLVVCLPAFLLCDALALVAVWSLLQHKRGRFSILSAFVACFITYGTPSFLCSHRRQLSVKCCLVSQPRLRPLSLAPSADFSRLVANYR